MAFVRRFPEDQKARWCAVTIFSGLLLLCACTGNEVAGGHSTTDQERTQDHPQDARKAAIKRSEDYYLSLGKKLGHIDLKPTDTSELSLTRLLNGAGEEAEATLDDSMTLTWADAGVKCTYFKPKHTKSQRAAEVTLRLHKKEGTVLWQSRLLDISFAGLKPGVSTSDLLTQLRIAGVRIKGGGVRWALLPNGWDVSWDVASQRVQLAFDLEPLADVGEYVHELRFSNPEYTIRSRGDPIPPRPQ